MEINHLREFILLTEIGNFLETAEQLFISQSALSRHIKAIEEELGVPLFDRTTRKVELNQFGQLFLPYAKQITNIQYEYSTAFYNQLKNISDTVTIGSIPVMAQYNITDVLTRFQQENPSLSLNIVEADTVVLIDMLKNRQCDFAFIRESEVSDNHLVKIPYTVDSLAAVLPSTHPFARRESVSLKELENETFILLAENTMMYNLCLAECKKAGFQPKVAFTGHRAENIIDLVYKGIGISLLTKKPAIFMAGPNISLVDITPAITTTIYLAYDKSNRMSIAGNHFMSYFNSLQNNTSAVSII